jgi:hypothetical protein
MLLLLQLHAAASTLHAAAGTLPLVARLPCCCRA